MKPGLKVFANICGARRSMYSVFIHRDSAGRSTSPREIAGIPVVRFENTTGTLIELRKNATPNRSSCILERSHTYELHFAWNSRARCANTIEPRLSVTDDE